MHVYDFESASSANRQKHVLVVEVDEACNPPSGASTLITAETPGTSATAIPVVDLAHVRSDG